jgi:hypothetical protein
LIMTTPTQAERIARDTQAERDFRNEHAREISQSAVLRLDGEALEIRDRVAGAFGLAGLGSPPEPQAGQTAGEYQRMVVSRLKPCAGLSALKTDGLSDGVVGHLVADCVQKVNENWQRPYDLAPGQVRGVSVTDRAGRASTTLVVGRGTESAFRTLYGEFLAPAQQAMAIGGVKL